VRKCFVVFFIAVGFFNAVFECRGYDRSLGEELEAGKLEGRYASVIYFSIILSLTLSLSLSLS